MRSDLASRLLDHHAPESVVRKVQTVLEQEKMSRKAFREWLKPDVKAEFINGEIIMHSPAKRGYNKNIVVMRLYASRPAE